MKDMNVLVEVKSGLKLFKMIYSSVYNACEKTESGKSRFVYNVCGYHTSPIPSQLQSKLQFAHPSPLLQNYFTKIIGYTISILLMSLDKLNMCIELYYTSMLNSLSSINHVFSSDINNDITSRIEYNKIG